MTDKDLKLKENTPKITQKKLQKKQKNLIDTGEDGAEKLISAIKNPKKKKVVKKAKKKVRKTTKKIPMPVQNPTEKSAGKDLKISKEREAKREKKKVELKIPENPFKVMETKYPITKAEAEHNKITQIKVMITEWCVDYPRLKPDEYLIEKGLEKEGIEEVFNLVPEHKWREKKDQFTDEVVTRLTVRGIDRVALEYDKDLKAAQEAKADILKRITEGEIEVVERDPDGKVVKAYFRKATAQELNALTRSYETLQKITDRSLGITDNNRESILENIKSREREVKEKSDKEVMEIKKLSYDDTKSLIALYREEKLSKEANDDGENSQ